MQHNLVLPRPLPSAIAIGLTLLIWFVIPVPEGVKPNAWQLLALFIGTIAAIIGKAIDGTVTSWNPAPRIVAVGRQRQRPDT